jgi:histidinol phosphatase-like enzyme
MKENTNEHNKDNRKDNNAGDQQNDPQAAKNAAEETPIYLTSNSTLQTPSEHRHDQSVDATKDTTIEVSRDDLHDIKLGTLTGRDDMDNEQE